MSDPTTLSDAEIDSLLDAEISATFPDPRQAFEFKEKFGLNKLPPAPDLPYQLSIPEGEPGFVESAISAANPINAIEGLVDTASLIGDVGYRKITGQEVPQEEMNAALAGGTRLAGATIGTGLGALSGPLGAAAGGGLGSELAGELNRYLGTEPEVASAERYLGEQVGGALGGAALGGAAQASANRIRGIPRIRQIKENIEGHGGNVAAAIEAQLGTTFSAIPSNVIAYEKTLPALQSLIDRNFFGGKELDLNTLTFTGKPNLKAIRAADRLTQIEESLIKLGPIKSKALSELTDAARMHNLMARPSLASSGLPNSARISGFQVDDLDQKNFSPQPVGGTLRYRHKFQEPLARLENLQEMMLGSQDLAPGAAYLIELERSIKSKLDKTDAGFILPTEIQEAMEELNSAARMQGMFDENRMSAELRDKVVRPELQAIIQGYPLLRNALMSLQDATISEIQSKIPPSAIPPDSTMARINEYNNLYHSLKVAEDDFRTLKVKDAISVSNRPGNSLVPNPASKIMGLDESWVRGVARATIDAARKGGLGEDVVLAKQNEALARLGETIPTVILDMQRFANDQLPEAVSGIPLSVAMAQSIASQMPQAQLPPALPMDTREILKYRDQLARFAEMNPNSPAAPFVNDVISASSEDELELALGKLVLNGFVSPAGEQYGYKALVNGKITNQVDYAMAERRISKIPDNYSRYEAMLKLRTKRKPPKSGSVSIEFPEAPPVTPTTPNTDYMKPEPVEKEKTATESVMENLKE